MGNSTSSGQPLYTMLNSVFNLLNHLVVIDKYISMKLGRPVDPLDYVTQKVNGKIEYRDFTLIFCGDDAVNIYD